MLRAKKEDFQIYSPKRVCLSQRANIPSFATHVTLTNDYHDNQVDLVNLPSSVIYFNSGKAGLRYDLKDYHDRNIPVENLKFSLPETLKSLHYLGPTMKNLPPSLTELTCMYLPPNLPLNLTYLDVRYAIIPENFHWLWPSSLRHLKIKIIGQNYKFFPPFPSLLTLEYTGLNFPNVELSSSLQSLKISGCLPPNLIEDCQ